MFIPYVYKIGWSKHNKFYIGSQYGYMSKIANPTNLWNSYFTSSDRVLDFRNTHGEPDILEILYTNENFKMSDDERADDVLKAEANFLKIENAKLNENFLNKSDTFCFRANDEISNEKRSKTQKRNYKKNSEYRKKISEGVKAAYTKDPSMAQRIKNTIRDKGWQLTEESKTKMSISAKKRANSDEGKLRMKNAAIIASKKLSEDPIRKKEVYEKVAAGTRGIKRNKVECPYCHKNGALNVMSRWHFDNCKFKSES